MEKKIAQFQNRGMIRDTSISKASNELAFENFNIRITARDHDTLLSVTNERGNSRISIDTEYSYTAIFKCYEDGEWTLSSPFSREISIVFTDVSGNSETTVISPGTSSGNNFMTTGGDVADIDVVIDGVAYSVDIVYQDNNDVEHHFSSTVNMELSIEGTLIGYSVLNSFLVLFTTGTDDHIYRIEYHALENPEWTGIELYSGDLNFSVEHPIEALSHYESDSVQKVYWVDGLNQPRLINIMKGEYQENEFDFVSSFHGVPSVSITKEYTGAGLFPAGVVQYFISYFRKFGQESNIVYSSDLVYSSFQDRGGSPEDTCTNLFRLQITGLDQSFDYIRVYSIVRTSHDSQVSAYIVGDYGIGDTVTVIDTGKDHESIDPSIIQYTGGRIISADTLSQKDGTLFLGNLELKDVETYDELESLIHDTCFILSSGKFEYGKTWESGVVTFSYSKEIPVPEAKGFYPYENQLNFSRSEIAYFKGGEKYRFAVQFIDRYGSRTKAFWIGDKENTLYPVITGDSYVLAEARLVLPDALVSYISDKYIGVEFLMAETSGLTRSVVAQGVLNPTLFNLGNRFSGQAFSISSWFMRPDRSGFNTGHFMPLGSTDTTMGEVQCNSYTMDETPTPYYDDSYSPGDDSERIIYAFKYVMAFSKASISSDDAPYAGLYCILYTSEDLSSQEVILLSTNSSDGWISYYGFPIFPIVNFMVTFALLGIPEELIPSNSTYDRWMQSISDTDFHFFSAHGEVGSSIPRTGENTKLPMDIINDPNVPLLTLVTASDWRSQSYVSENSDKFFVDRNIVTFNTPDIDSLVSYDNSTGLKLRLIGYSEVTANMTDYIMNVSNPSSINNSILSLDFSNANVTDDSDGLVAYPLYTDSINPSNNPGNSITTYMIYPWQKNGSLINASRSDGSLFSQLESKTLSNLRFSYHTTFYDYNDFVQTAADIESLRVVTSTEKTSYAIEAYGKQVIYNGNNDFAVLNPRSFNLYTTGSTPITSIIGFTNINLAKLQRSGGTVESKDGVPIKYKSDGHVVLSFGTLLKDGKVYYELLPDAPYEKENYYSNTYLPWLSYNSSGIDFSSAKRLFNVDGNMTVPACSSSYLIIGDSPVQSIACNIRMPYKEFMPKISSVDPVNRYLLIDNPDDSEYRYFVVDAYTAFHSGMFTTRTRFTNPSFTVSYSSSGDTLTFSLTNASTDLQRAVSNGFKLRLLIEGYKDSIWHSLYESELEISTGNYNLHLEDASYPYRITLQFVREETEYGVFINSNSVVSDTLNPGDTSSEVTSVIEVDPTEDIVTRMLDTYILPYDNLVVYNPAGYSCFLVSRLNLTEVYDDSGFGTYSQPLPRIPSGPHLLIGELYIDYSDISPEDDPRYGGITESAVSGNVFIPIGSGLVGDSEIFGKSGDTYLQRWDCLKTYPFTEGDVNSIVDITSLMLESHTNLDGRYDNKRGMRNNLYATPEDFNLINAVYSQDDNFITASVLDSKYNSSSYPYSITYTKQKQNLSDVDLWTNITLSSILDMDGDKGPVRAIRRYQNSLIAFQDKGIAEVLYNSRTQLSTEQSIPIEIGNSGKVDGKRYITDKSGCLNKWSIVETGQGIYFIDNINSSISLFNGSIQSLSDTKGFKSWIGNRNITDIWNPSGFSNFVSYWDRINDDVYFLKAEDGSNLNTLCYNEQLQQFVSFYDYGKVPMMVNVQDRFIAFRDGGLWLQGEGQHCKLFGEFQDFHTVYRVTPTPYSDKIFSTLEYRADMFDMNGENPYMNGEGELTRNTFDSLEVWNEYQWNKVDLHFDIRDTYPDNRRKFRIWRTDIPRDRKGSDNPFGLNRIRNPWIYLKLECNMSRYNDDGGSPDPGHDERMEFHDLLVRYYE